MNGWMDGRIVLVTGVNIIR